MRYITLENKYCITIYFLNVYNIKCNLPYRVVVPTTLYLSFRQLCMGDYIKCYDVIMLLIV